jgi:N-acetylmuramoyl-L-alanine amidase
MHRIPAIHHEGRKSGRKGRWLSSLFGAAARRMKVPVVRLTTTCAAIGAAVAWVWLSGNVLSGKVLAADSEAIGPPAQRYTATCPHAATFRTVIDVGHTADAPGATSARGVTEYEFNLRLAHKISDDLVAAGFARTVLMVTAEAPRAGLFKRAAHANALHADLFLSIHHDSVPDAMLQTWQFNGHEQHYNDSYPGHSLFVSTEHANRAESLAFAHLLGMALAARGLHYTPHYTDAIMGAHRRVLLDAKAGVYEYNQLVVLMETQMPAALLEAGSIINRDEELALATPERQALIGGAVVEAVDAFCKGPKRKSHAQPDPKTSSARSSRHNVGLLDRIWPSSNRHQK